MPVKHELIFHILHRRVPYNSHHLSACLASTPLGEVLVSSSLFDTCYCTIGPTADARVPLSCCLSCCCSYSCRLTYSIRARMCAHRYMYPCRPTKQSHALSLAPSLAPAGPQRRTWSQTLPVDMLLSLPLLGCRAAIGTPGHRHTPGQNDHFN